MNIGLFTDTYFPQLSGVATRTDSGDRKEEREEEPTASL